jgi:hypothetical protein
LSFGETDEKLDEPEDLAIKILVAVGLESCHSSQCGAIIKE